MDTGQHRNHFGLLRNNLLLMGTICCAHNPGNSHHCPQGNECQLGLVEPVPAERREMVLVVPVELVELVELVVVERKEMDSGLNQCSLSPLVRSKHSQGLLMGMLNHLRNTGYQHIRFHRDMLLHLRLHTQLLMYHSIATMRMCEELLGKSNGLLPSLDWHYQLRSQRQHH
jgi:hypothetical protein